MPASLPRKHPRVSAWLRRIYLHFCIGPLPCPFSQIATHRKLDQTCCTFLNGSRGVHCSRSYLTDRDNRGNRLRRNSPSETIAPRNRNLGIDRHADQLG